MFPVIFALLLLIAPTVFAEPFIELGVGKTFSTCDCKYSDDPVGYVAAGYQVPNTGLIFQVDHHSSMTHKDYGQNMVSVRYRFTFGGSDE